jgi:hypothetical protein
MPKYQIEVVQRTFFWVAAADEEQAKKIVLEWQISWTQPDSSVVDGKGGIEIGEIGDVSDDGTVIWRDD